MTTTAPTRIVDAVAGRPPLQRIATAVAALIALVYGLTYAGVLRISGASTEELGILGVAATVFVAQAVLLWWRRSRMLWAAVAALQVLMAWMYIAIAPERDPSYEVWGITIRVLSLGLLAAVVGLLLTARRDRAGVETDAPPPVAAPTDD
jgi:hypothetical protein